MKSLCMIFEKLEKDAASSSMKLTFALFPHPVRDYVLLIMHSGYVFLQVVLFSTLFFTNLTNEWLNPQLNSCSIQDISQTLHFDGWILMWTLLHGISKVREEAIIICENNTFTSQTFEIIILFMCSWECILVMCHFKLFC